jgi:hypothetical protein
MTSGAGPIPYETSKPARPRRLPELSKVVRQGWLSCANLLTGVTKDVSQIARIQGIQVYEGRNPMGDGADESGGQQQRGRQQPVLK